MLITIEKVLLLKQMPMFKTVSNMALSDLMAVAEEQTLKKGEELMMPSDQNKNAYFVLSGRILEEDDSYKKTYEAHSVVGLDSIFWIAPVGKKVTVKQEAVVLKIERDKLYRMMSLHPSLAMAILHELSEKTHKQKKD